MPEEDLIEALRTSLLENDQLHQLNQQLTKASREPIRIVGMGCRYPGGVPSPEDLWQLVSSGEDAVVELPTDRGWDVAGLVDPDQAAPHTLASPSGGFLVGATEFDPAFFGISRNEVRTKSSRSLAGPPRGRGNSGGARPEDVDELGAQWRRCRRAGRRGPRGVGGCAAEVGARRGRRS